MATEELTVTTQLRPWRRVLSQLFVIYVALNMVVCSILFAPWALPRETVSGLLGRWASTERGLKRRFGMCAGSVVDVIYFWEPNHCYETFKIERRAREILYP